MVATAILVSMRSSSWSLALFLAAASGLLGCSQEEDDAEALSCEFFEADNCWREALLEAAACVPGSEDRGMFNADLTSCTYADGSTVTFDEPAQVPQGDEVLWDFTVSTPSAEACASFYDDTELGSGSGSIELTTASGTVTESLVGTTLTVTCPEGDRYRGSSFSLLQCDDLFTDLPGRSTAWSDTSLSFSLSGTGEDPLPIFACDK